ncbi:homoserine kinase [Arachnia propionica]|uniref:Homoserine kinase n=1 Tax=Arachnia propionica TaxID=1750 RepID=A0A3P1TC85_9ACTN|nr:homoserine kinase [Arachnia propionica]MDO5082567.1 homoserine kinase [Arachnia propionica]RRD07061.1 homoserine kinase [Arachnia propionica]
MRLRVRVPATTANLGSGFDCVGLAVDWYDDLTLEVQDTPGVVIEVTGEGAGEVPRDGSHLVISTIRHCLELWQVPVPVGLRLSAHNTIPHSRGLGSSAAAIAAGCALAHGLAWPNRELDLQEVARVACLLEGHPDNAGAAVWGGAVLAWISGDRVEVIRLEPAEGLRCIAFVPALEVPTSGARGVLPEAVPRSDAVAQAIRAAILPKALERRPDLLLEATSDRLHQLQRAPLMPESWELMNRLRDSGVPATISGAGPTVFALGLSEQLAGAAALTHDGFERHDLGIGTGISMSIR